MSLKSFIGHYASEAGKIASALSTIASGIALGGAERNVVSDTVETLENAVTNILAGIDKITDPVVKISKTDLQAAVKDFVTDSDAFKSAVAEAVAAELARVTAQPASDA